MTLKARLACQLLTILLLSACIRVTTDPRHVVARFGADATAPGPEALAEVDRYFVSRGLARLPDDGEFGRDNMSARYVLGNADDSCIEVYFLIAPDSRDFRAVNEERDAFVAAFRGRDGWDVMEGGGCLIVKKAD